jgi:hypothetical protein
MISDSKEPYTGMPNSTRMKFGNHGHPRRQPSTAVSFAPGKGLGVHVALQATWVKYAIARFAVLSTMTFTLRK